MIDLTFVKAGKAIFTVSNPKAEHYTYKVTKKPGKDLWFISLLTGPSNTSDYQYIGLLVNDQCKTTAKSVMTKESKPVKVFDWAMSVLSSEAFLPPNYRIEHEGFCGKCARTLTTPESIEAGFGPTCLNSM